MPLLHSTSTVRPLPESACEITVPANPAPLPTAALFSPAVPQASKRPHEQEPLPVVSHAEMADMVMAVLRPLDEAGKPVRVHPHLLGIQLWTLVLHHFTARGEFFRTGGAPYYLDRVDRALISLEGSSPELGGILRQLGLLNGRQTTKVVVANLIDYAATSPERPLYRLPYMAEDYSAVYLNAGGTRMYKVTANAISECTMGEDSVVLLASDIAPWPPDEDLRREIERLRPVLGHACANPVPSAPSSLLTTRWSCSTALAPGQAQWFYLNHYFFRCVDSGYSLKPILLLFGEQGSGKSTAVEVQLAVRAGRKVEPQALPEKKDIVAAASTRSLLAWDNVDGIDDSALSDTLCLIATGGDVDMREYYTTAQLRTVPMRNHAMLLRA